MDTLPGHADSSAPPLGEREKNIIIGGVLLAILLAALDQTIVAPALPTIGAALGHADYLPWVVTAYLLTATAAAPLYGKISDVYGRRGTIHAAMFLFLLGSVVSAMAPNMLVLVLGRAIQGAGGGGLFTLAQTVIGDLVPPKERARYVAWISGTWAVASIAGPLLGGVFAEHLHWSLVFWVNIPLGIAAAAIMNGPLKKLPIVGRRHSIDLLGALLLLAATTILMLVLNWGGSEYRWMSVPIMALFAGSALAWALFALRLRHAAEPLVSLEVLANPVVLWGAMAIAMLSAANVGLTVYLPLYLQSVVGLTASQSGTAMLPFLLGTVVGASLGGRLVARIIRYKRIAAIGLAFGTLGVITLGILAAGDSLPLVYILFAIIGAGMGTMFPVGTVSVQNAVDHAHLGVATGVLSFLRSLGSALGVAALGAVALGYGMPLAHEATQVVVSANVASRAFAGIFYASAIMLVASIGALALMPEKPLRSSHVREETAISG